MNTKRFFLGMAGMIATMAMFTACSQNEAEDIVPISKNNVISLTSSMETMRGVSDPQTNALSANNTVGVFVTSGETTITNGDNNQHSVGNEGVLSTTKAMYYPAEDGAKVNIYAYAPYKSGIALATANSFSVATDQSAEAGYLSSDLVSASKENQASSESAVSLTFGHKMSQLQITINNQASLDLSEAAVYITGTKITTTFNPSTGTIGDATGDATDIKSVAALGTDTKAYTIVVPQTIAANTALVKITTSEKTYIAKLSAAATLASGKAYKFSVTLTSSTEPVVEVPISLSATSITEWGTPTDIGTATMEEVVSYEIGDYVLTDGTFMKASAYATASADDKAKVAGIIFSKNVSTIDAEAGYNAYAVGLSRKKQSFTANTDYPDQMCTPLLGTSFADAFGDLDGRTRTSQMLECSYYNALDADGKTAFIGNLSWYTKTISANASDWFLPSFGQLMQILNNLGGASITSSSVTVGSSTAEVACLDATQEGTVVEALLAKITAAGGANDVFKKGNIDYASSSENGSANNTGHSGKIWGLKIKATNSDTEWNGLTVGRHYSRGTTQYSVIPVAAVTLPTE